MIRKQAVAALSVVALAAAPVAVAATSHAGLWQNPAGTVTCGVEIHTGKTATEVLCTARGIPRASKSPVGDPFVQIAAHGKPQLELISQDSYVSSHSVHLKPGATWSDLGVTCKLASKTVTCSNKSGHGFTIGNGKYKRF